LLRIVGAVTVGSADGNARPEGQWTTRTSQSVPFLPWHRSGSCSRPNRP